jgi:hypothetical protein
MEGFCFAVSVKKGPNEPNTAKDDDDDGLMWNKKYTCNKTHHFTTGTCFTFK